MYGEKMPETRKKNTHKQEKIGEKKTLKLKEIGEEIYSKKKKMRCEVSLLSPTSEAKHAPKQREIFS